jgi:glycosyltransferase involved in cell wall biosynthesis
MKIIAILDKDISSGGGFNQALNAILQMQKLCTGRFDFEVFTTHFENLPYLKKLNLNSHVINISIISRLLAQLGTCIWWQFLQSFLKLIGPLEKKLIRHGCDLVYFVTPGPTAASLQKLNYITTVWDLCHRDFQVFPEVRNFNEFHIRERNYQNNLGPALVVLTDSKQLAESAAFRYGIDPSHFLPMPFSPSPFLNQKRSFSKDEVISKYGIKDGYFYYPAQFWAHKNHIRILEALLILKVREVLPNVVFSGKDFGNRKYLEEFVVKHGLEEQVNFLGFVPTEDIRGLYEGSLAVLMPTYFGPTNLPPLEAWTLEKPLIYSEHLIEQAGDAALLINPDNANEIAEAMITCFDPDVRRQLVDSGKRRLHFFASQRTEAENNLLKKLDEFAAKRRCWR